MLRYIIRLDDATPKMNKENWQKVENMLDKHGIKPIVGVIPDNHDTLFRWESDPDFWTETVSRWKNKGWTIAQHGYHHVFHICENGIRSEFTGLSYAQQMEKIQSGYAAMCSHGVIPECFFAPAHTFDQTTVDVCRDSKLFQFISDGYAFFPYRDRNMLFLPSIFDTAHKILPFGVYTFILHPSFTTEEELAHLHIFIGNNKQFFSSVPEILAEVDCTRKRNALEYLIHPAMKTLRNTRNTLRKLSMFVKKHG